MERGSRFPPGALSKEAMKKKRLKIERSSGNVFEDLGFSAGEAKNLQLRAQLMSKIRAVARDMTQAEAAKRLGVTQPRLNDALRGKIDKFSGDARRVARKEGGLNPTA